MRGSIVRGVNKGGNTLREGGIIMGGGEDIVWGDTVRGGR